MKCSSCKRELEKGSVEIKCPNCNRKIFRCLRCRKLSVKYKCECGFEGP